MRLKLKDKIRFFPRTVNTSRPV